MKKFDATDDQVERFAILGGATMAGVARVYVAKKLLQRIWPDTGWKEAWLVAAFVQSVGAWFHQGWHNDAYVVEKTGRV